MMFGLHLGKNKKKDNWPKKEDGEPVRPVFLEHISGNAIDSEITLGLLEAYGIPTVCRYPNDGEFGKIILGNAAGGIDVFVPETMLEDARNILSADICEDEEN
jgi:hypothetical protein